MTPPLNNPVDPFDVPVESVPTAPLHSLADIRATYGPPELPGPRREATQVERPAGPPPKEAARQVPAQEQTRPLGPRPLFNAMPPNRFIKHERYHHRMICYLRAEGYNNREIAEKTGLFEGTVSQILRQPYCQDFITQLLHEQGTKGIEKMLSDIAPKAIRRIEIEIDNEATGTAATRITAADKALDRLFGKPNQPIEHREQNLETLSDAELERIANTDS